VVCHRRRYAPASPRPGPHRPAGRESDPDLVERFTEALAEAQAYADENPDEARATVTSYTSLTDEQIAAVTLPRFPTEFNRESIERIAELAEEDGLLEERVDVDQLLP
jgi:NitT/TauT family transport system substrate-binding protein